VLTFEPAAPRRVVFAGPTLGIAFEPSGVVKGVQPGGEAQQKGVRAGDRVVKVGAAAVTTDASIRAAVVAHPARPIELTLA
jgi:S1-C subfamily serine protease